MPQIDDQQLQRVNSRMNYIASTGERPAYYLYEPRPGYTPPPPAAPESPRARGRADGGSRAARRTATSIVAAPPPLCRRLA